jgi:hypothetical protein
LARLNPDGSLDTTFRPGFVQLSEIHRQRSIRIARLSKSRTRLAESPEEDPSPGGAPQQGSAETALITRMELEPGRAAVHFKGKPGQHYVLQARESAGKSQEWINVASVEAKSDGTGVLRDPASLQHPFRLYRIAKP